MNMTKQKKELEKISAKSNQKPAEIFTIKKVSRLNLFPPHCLLLFEKEKGPRACIARGPDGLAP